MRELKINSIYAADTISKNNDTVWDKLLGILDSEKSDGGDILLDFEGIQLKEPFLNDKFIRIIRNNNVHIKIYNDKELADLLEITVSMHDDNKERCMKRVVFINQIEKLNAIKNINIKPNKTHAAELRKISSVVRMNNGNMYLGLYKVYDQLGQVKTVELIQEVLIDQIDKHKPAKVEILFKTMQIASITFKSIADLALKIKEKYNISTIIRVDDNKTADEISLFCSNKMLGTKKMEKFVRKMPKNFPGVLVKYIPSKTVDRLGRQSNGETLNYLPAIIHEFFEDSDGHYYADISVYTGNTFYTKIQWASDNDGHVYERLPCKREKIRLDEIGLFGKSIGEKYHFEYRKPIKICKCTLESKHKSCEECKLIMYVKPDGTVGKKWLNVWETIEIVFDDWGIKYYKA